MFSITNWILGYSLSKLGTNAIENISNKDFFDKLNNVISEWAKELPKEDYLNPSSIFPKFNENNEYLSILKDKFIKKELPEKIDWYNSIYTQWKFIKNEFGDEAQEFYQLDNEQAKFHINVLSEKLDTTCRLENEFFKIKVLTDLDNILYQINEVSKETKKSTIGSKLDSIEEIKKSLKILNAFWPLSPLLTRDLKNYSVLHKILEKAILEIHKSYDILCRYSDQYGIKDKVKNSKKALINSLNGYLEFVDNFYLGKINREIEPKDMALLIHSMQECINSWNNFLILVKEKLKIELEDE